MLEKYLHHLYFQQDLYPFEMLAAVKFLVSFSLCWYHHQNHFLWVWDHGTKLNKEKKTVMACNKRWISNAKINYFSCHWLVSCTYKTLIQHTPEAVNLFIKAQLTRLAFISKISAILRVLYKNIDFLTLVYMFFHWLMSWT